MERERGREQYLNKVESEINNSVREKLVAKIEKAIFRVAKLKVIAGDASPS